jgi:hypothetical protein
MTRKFGWTKNVLIHQIENQSYEKTLLGQTNFDKALTPKLRASTLSGEHCRDHRSATRKPKKPRIGCMTTSGNGAGAGMISWRHRPGGRTPGGMTSMRDAAACIMDNFLNVRRRDEEKCHRLLQR